MEKQMSLAQLEALIRKNINDKGLMKDISEEKIIEIKNKIRSKMRIPSMNFFAMDMSNDSVDGGGDSGVMEEQPQEFGAGDDVELPVQVDKTPAIQSTVSNQQNMDSAKKEGELTAREQMLSQKEEELRQKEAMLNQKAQELAYKPELPSFIQKAEPEKIFVFNTNELSLGSESLMRQPYHLVDNPNEQKSLHDLWLEQGKTKAEVYQVEFKKIGDMEFRPLDGICKFEHMTPQIPTDIPQDDRDSVAQAILSQTPTEPMEDSIEPIKDVTLPLAQDMGLQAPDVAAVMQDVIDKALRSYLTMKNSI